MEWNNPASGDIIKKTIESLRKNNIDATLASDIMDAKKKLFKLIPEGAEVMTMSSVTLDNLSIPQLISESSEYHSVKTTLSKMDRKIESREMQKLGAAPEYAIGSVHAVTEDGKVLIASNTGSQLPAYSYGSDHVIWLVGIQKIVKNIDEGIKRIYEHSFPLENERAKKVYGTPSNVSKILIINKEIKENRLHLIFIPEVIGF